MARKMYNTKFVTTKPPASNVGGDEMQFAVIRVIKLSCAMCVSRTQSTAAFDRLKIFKYSPITIHKTAEPKCRSIYLFLSRVAKATVRNPMDQTSSDLPRTIVCSWRLYIPPRPNILFMWNLLVQDNLTLYCYNPTQRMHTVFLEITVIFQHTRSKYYCDFNKIMCIRLFEL